jgi:fucose permease
MAYYAAFVTLGMVAASLGPTLPDLAKNTHTQLSGISFLFFAGALGRLFGVFQGGRLYDRVAGHQVMVITLIVIAIMMALVPIIPLLWLLTAILLIRGAAQGMLDLGGNTLLVWVHRDKVGPFMNGLHFAFGIGAFLSPIIIAQVVLIGGGITWAYWVLAFLVLPAAIWLMRLPSPAAQTVSKDSPVGQVDNLLVALIALFFFLYVGAEIGYSSWIFTYALATDLANETISAYLTSAFFATLTLGRLLAIPIAARFRPRSIVFSNLGGCLVSMAIILLWPNSLATFWLGTLGLGLSMASTFPTMLSLAESRVAMTGRVTSWLLVGGSLGGMFLPWLMGQLFEPVGPQATILTTLIALIAAVGVLVAVILYSNRSTRNQPGSSYK